MGIIDINANSISLSVVPFPEGTEGEGQKAKLESEHADKLSLIIMLA